MAQSNQPTGGKKEFLLRLKDARIGEPAAQYEVALMYANGVGVSKDVEQAFVWTRSAAEKGHAQAQYLLARAYHQGLGTVADVRQAMAWYRRAAEHGNEKASWNLAKLLAEPQAEVAFQYALDAAQKGLLEAEFWVGEYYRKGGIVAQDLEEAYRWYLSAAQKGSARAQHAIAGMLEMRKAKDQDYRSTMDWYRMAAAQGMPAAQLALERLDTKGRGRLDEAGKASRRPGSKERRLANARWVNFASKGDAEDFFHLGCMFEQGIAVEKSTKQARLWFQKAAERGHLEASALLARSYLSSAPELAATWYQKAAEGGHPAAQFALAQLQTSGAGVADAQAFYWYAAAAQQGHASAQAALAGQLQTASEALQKELLWAAAQGGVAPAQFALGERYARGEGLEQDWYQACQWYQKAAEQEYAPAQCALAACFAEGFGVKRDVAKAFLYFEKAAAQDDAKAQWKLGELYAAGIPGVAADTKQATQLCKRAAQAGFAPAQATFGTLFARAEKHERAVFWWEKAAEQGDLEAQFNLAHACLKGVGIQKNEARAWDLMLSAAQSGLPAAQGKLGLAYATGEGMVQDLIESAKWFCLAAAQGDKSALSNKKRAQNILSPAQFAEATRRASAVQSAAASATGTTAATSK
jgi:TPR repeat protein